MRSLLQPAYVLHQRPYRNTSALLEVLTRDHGRIGIIAKGIKSKNNVRQRGLLQPFVPLLLNFSGKHELHTLVAVESSATGVRLSGRELFSAFYLNELLMRALQRNDPHEKIYYIYDDALIRLGRSESCEPVLRRFEMHLLQELGYGLSFATEAFTHQPIQADAHYFYDPLQGAIAFDHEPELQLPRVSGACLQALAHEEFDDSRYWLEMKTLMRQAIQYFIDDRPLSSRELFISGN